LKIGSLKSEKIIIESLESEKIGSLQVYTEYLTFFFKKNLSPLETFGSERSAVLNSENCNVFKNPLSLTNHSDRNYFDND